MKILLIEDEKPLSDALCQIFSKKRWETFAAYNGETGLDEALTGIYDIILLDIMLPKLDGLTVLQRLREASISTPVLLLSAKGEISDKVAGLDCGADDYLAKPFATEELLARIRAMTRRRGELIFDDTLQVGDLTLNLANYTLSRRDQRVQLANKEFEIMKQFFLHTDTILNKEELLTRLWGFENGAAGNNVEVYISFLRKKLTYLCSQMRIACIRNVGYRLEEPLCFGS